MGDKYVSETKQNGVNGDQEGGDEETSRSYPYFQLETVDDLFNLQLAVTFVSMEDRNGDKTYVTKNRTTWSQWWSGKGPADGSMVFRAADVVMEGYLLKQGVRLRRMSKRYFILRLEERHMTLSYYYSKEDLTLCQEFPIGSGHKIVINGEGQHPFRFELVFGTKRLVLEAPDSEQYKKWRDSLQEAVVWNQTMVPSGESVISYGKKVEEEEENERRRQEAKRGFGARKSAANQKGKGANNAQEKKGGSKSRGSRAPKYIATERVGHHAFIVSNCTFEIPQRYQFMKTLGAGAYGVVISATDRESGEAVAIKNVQKAFDDLTDAKRIVREIKLMRHLNHKNLLGVLDIFKPPTLEEFEDVYIVSELMATDLHRVIYSRHALSDEHMSYFIYQMLCALKYIHSAGVIHRDLKPSNILLNGNCDLKICDFGLARGVVQEEEMELTEYVVTRWYRAPEIMLGCMNYTSGVDVWSLGCMFAEMLGRKPLFPGQDYIDQLHLIMNVLGAPKPDDLEFLTNGRAKKFLEAEWHKRLGAPVKSLNEIFKSANPKAIDLMSKMLKIDPKERISVDEALQHPYLASVRCTEDETVCPEMWDYEFEQMELTKSTIQGLIFAEVCHFHPDALDDNLEKLSPRCRAAALKAVSEAPTRPSPASKQAPGQPAMEEKPDVRVAEVDKKVINSKE